MIESLTPYQKARIWLSDFGFMQKPLGWMDTAIEKVEGTFSGYSVYLRYIVILFILTVLFVLLKILYRYFFNWHQASFSDFAGQMRMRFWQKYAEADEKAALQDVEKLFQEARKEARKSKISVQEPIGFDLFHQVMAAVGQGMSDSEILKILPSKYSLMDAAPIIETIRSFRDLAARKILEPHSREKETMRGPLKICRKDVLIVRLS